MACDICGKNIEILEELQSQYQTKEIKQVCSTCVREVNDHIWKLREMTTKINDHWTKRFMSAMRKKLLNK